MTSKNNSIIDLPWIEKYRPNNINDLLLDDNIKNKIQHFINNNNLPNIIISGNPGLGKTTTAICIAKYILGSHYNDGVIELNASDDRGLDLINNTIIHFCKKKFDIDGEKKFKIIILDEADNITSKAQNILTNFIETYKNTRFIFTCNDASKLNESIQSRCMLIRYSKLSNDIIKNKLISICNNENAHYTEDGIDTIIYISQGDIRLAINYLEGIFYGLGSITTENVYHLYDQPQTILITNIIKACMTNNLINAINYTNELKKKGYCVNDIILGLNNVLKDIKIIESTRIKYIQFVNDTYIDINNSIESDLQLYSCLAKMCLLK